MDKYPTKPLLLLFVFCLLPKHTHESTHKYTYTHKHTHKHTHTHTGMGVFAYCNVHYHPEVCGEQISVPAGSTIVFDTRVTFINSGSCGLPENIETLYFLKGDVPLNECSARDNPCPHTYLSSPILAVWGGVHRFNLNLTKAYATVDDEALYTVHASKGVNSFLKRFLVTVEGKKMYAPLKLTTYIY